MVAVTEIDGIDLTIIDGACTGSSIGCGMGAWSNGRRTRRRHRGDLARIAGARHSQRIHHDDRTGRVALRTISVTASRAFGSCMVMQQGWRRSLQSRMSIMSARWFRVCPWSICPLIFKMPSLARALKAMGPGGFVVQYSYSPIRPIPAKKLGVKAEMVRYVLWNVPPATVWRFSALKNSPHG